MSTLWTLPLTGLGVVALVMLVTWFIARASANAGIVDVVWSASMGALALYYALAAEGDPTRRWLLALIACTWSARLTVYLWRRVVGKEEDGRYQAMRAALGAKADRGFFWFFQAQALVAVTLSLPFLVVAGAGTPLAPGWVVAALGVWLVALGGEAIADHQLDRFRRDPANRGRTCRAGLWRWSRHPNYFFEWLHWFAYVALSAGAAWWWSLLFGPLLMLALLYRVTGIPYTELQALKSRGEDYRDYQRTTSAFFPWFSKEQRRP